MSTKNDIVNCADQTMDIPKWKSMAQQALAVKEQI